MNYVQFVINNTINRSIHCSPARLLFGTDQIEFPDEELRRLLLGIASSKSEIEKSLCNFGAKADVPINKVREENERAFDNCHKKPHKYQVRVLDMLENTVSEPNVNEKLLPENEGP